MSTELDLDGVVALSQRAEQELTELRDLQAATAEAFDYMMGLTPAQEKALRKDAEIGRWLLAKFEECHSGWRMEALTINGAPSLETLEQAIGAAMLAAPVLGAA